MGLLTTPEPAPARVAPLLGRLRRWCVVRYATPREPVAAWFATSPRARGLARALEGRAPVAVWVSDDEDARRLGDASGVVVVGDEPAIIAPFGARGVLWGDGIDAERFRPVTPFVRARWRRRRGLPDRLVWAPAELAAPPPADVNSTAFALAGCCMASQNPPAMPHPISVLPRRIEPGAGLRLSQPNLAAPCS